MATNPMQRKARVSFILGMLITLVITGVIIAFLFMENKDLNEQLDSEANQKVLVSVLIQDVQYGEELTADKFIDAEVTKNAVPEDATNIATVTEGTPIAKVSMRANTVLTSSLITTDQINASDREQTYSIVSLPIDLQDGEYVDIRISFPNGQDYIVLSKKRAEIPAVNGVYVTDTIKLTLSEGEILAMSSAIVDAATVNGAYIYAIKYVEAATQNAAQETYSPSREVLELIDKNRSIIDEATAKLRERWNQTAQENRDQYINPQVQQGTPEGIIEDAQAEIESKQQAREEYLSTLVAPIE